jgi:pyrimidine-nucleoside phosphorylase
LRAVEIIEKKRDRQELSKAEIDFFVEGFAHGEIPDYQASAWTMAVFLNGMTPRETTDLTLAMANSGDQLDLSEVVPIAVDKHSTGGVGDKTTLVVAPVVAACGVAVGKMSGRGLGFSGGTLDKMESIPVYRTDLSTQEFMHQLAEIGIVLTGQTADLAPADGKLYALRDVTGTVQSTPLIASSVMSKKIAAGAQAIVLDVKLGKGAFMQTEQDARKLAQMMVHIAALTDRKAVALLSDMNQPLGQAVGNAIEVKEAIRALHGGGPQDFHEHCMVVSGHMLALGGVVENEDQGRRKAEKSLESGQAWDMFKKLVAAQGGDLRFVEDPDLLPAAPLIEDQAAPKTAYIAAINACTVGEMAVVLGAGREKKGDAIDHGVGIEVLHKVGERVEKGQPILRIHARDRESLDQARERLLQACRWSEQPVEALPLFYGVIKPDPL